MAEQIEGLSYDKVVFDFMEKEQKREGRGKGALNLSEAEKETGLSSLTILRAVAEMRNKGYPLISTHTRRTWENDFRMPQTQNEYLAWREKLAAEIADLQDILKICDQGATVMFGDVPKQEKLF